MKPPAGICYEEAKETGTCVPIKKDRGWATDLHRDDGETCEQDQRFREDADYQARQEAYEARRVSACIMHPCIPLSSPPPSAMLLLPLHRAGPTRTHATAETASGVDLPARLPPESCLISSGSSQSSGSAATVRPSTVDAELEREAGRVSRRMGYCWCWRWARKRPVDRPRVRGAAERRNAPRQRAAVAIFFFFQTNYL